VEITGGLSIANQRKKYPPEKKVEILCEHMKNKMSVSEVCEKYGIHPNMFYKWEKQLFERAIDLFSGERSCYGNNKEVAEVKKLTDKVQIDYL